MTESAPERFAFIINALCLRFHGQIGYGVLRPERFEGTFGMLVHNALRRIAREFAAVVARLAAGTLRPPTPRKPRDNPEPSQPRKPQRQFPDALRRDHGWLVRLFQPSAGAASAIYVLFRTPEMQALLEAAPQLRRILRPLCTMLDVTQPTAPAPDASKPTRRPRRSMWRFHPVEWHPGAWPPATLADPPTPIPKIA